MIYRSRGNASFYNISSMYKIQLPGLADYHKSHSFALSIFLFDHTFRTSSNETARN